MTQVAVNKFESIVGQIGNIGYNLHQNRLVEHAKLNLSHLKRSIKELPPLKGDKAKSAIIISAGPSVHKKNSIKKILDSGYKGTIIAVDGSYIACLKQGLIPDFVLTLDPHVTRVVRWFGDDNFEEHTRHDDYFARQDLDVDFRKNTIDQNNLHIRLVNANGHKSKAIVASSAPPNVVRRLQEAKFDIYGCNPLVDDPTDPKSLTRQMYDINKLPCMNTGGTVGTAAWVFAHSYLKVPSIALVGMDFGYYADTPKNQTQGYYELIEHIGNEEDIEQCFVYFTFPLDQQKFFIDPTYFWYRQNFLELLKQSKNKTFNCTEGGTLFGENLECISLNNYLSSLGK